MTEKEEDKGKGVLATDEHNQKVAQAQKDLVGVKTRLEDLGANELVIEILEVVNTDIFETLYKNKQPKKEAFVEGNTDKEKVQTMVAMTEQIENTVKDIWADSYQKEDMKKSLVELKRIFNGAAGI